MQFDDFMEDSVFPADASPKPERGHFEAHSVKNGAIDVKKVTEKWAQNVLDSMKNSEGILKPVRDSPENIARKISHDYGVHNLASR